jgi:hypothetical protein
VSTPPVPDLFDVFSGCLLATDQCFFRTTERRRSKSVFSVNGILMQMLNPPNNRTINRISVCQPRSSQGPRWLGDTAKTVLFLGRCTIATRLRSRTGTRATFLECSRFLSLGGELLGIVIHILLVLCSPSRHNAVPLCCPEMAGKRTLRTAVWHWCVAVINIYRRLLFTSNDHL